MMWSRTRVRMIWSSSWVMMRMMKTRCGCGYDSWSNCGHKMKWRFDWFWRFRREESKSRDSGVEKMRRNWNLPKWSLIWRRRNSRTQSRMRLKFWVLLWKV